MRRLLLLLLAAAVLLTAIAFAGVGLPSAARADTNPRHDVVTTVGRGVITTVPDVASISVGVRTEAATAADALAQNAARMTAVVAAVRKAGADEVQTSQVSLYPSTDQKGKTIGYQAQNTVVAKAKVAETGALIDAAVAAGGNTVDGPALERSDRDALYRQALAKALDDAKAKAEALAKAGGFAVGKVVAVTEGAAETPQPLSLQLASAKDATTPIEPGKQDTEALVTVSFEIS